MVPSLELGVHTPLLIHLIMGPHDLSAQGCRLLLQRLYALLVLCLLALLVGGGRFEKRRTHRGEGARRDRRKDESEAERRVGEGRRGEGRGREGGKRLEGVEWIKIGGEAGVGG